MKKIFLIPGLLISLFITTSNAQGTNTPKNTLAANQNHPALSSPPAKAPVAQKEPRRAKTVTPAEIHIKPAKK